MTENGSRGSSDSLPEVMKKVDLVLNKLNASIDTMNLSILNLETKDEELARDGKRSRTLIYAGLIIVISMSVVITMLINNVRDIKTVSEQAFYAESLANQSIRKQEMTCEVTNIARSDQNKVWEYVLELTKDDPRNQSLSGAETVKEFRTFLRQLYGPRDCTQYNKSNMTASDLKPSTLPIPEPTQPSQ